MMTLLKRSWFFHNRAPDAFSADPEQYKQYPRKVLAFHDIYAMTRTAQSSSKNGCDRSSGIFKNILNPISNETTAGSPVTLKARASIFLQTYACGPVVSLNIQLFPNDILTGLFNFIIYHHAIEYALSLFF